MLTVAVSKRLSTQKFPSVRAVVAIGNSRCPVGEETLEYKDLSQPSDHNDKGLSNWPPGDVEVECLCYVTTLGLVLAIQRLILHYLDTPPLRRIITDTIYTVSQKSSHLEALCNFVKSWPIFKIFALLESVWNFLQNQYDTTHLTLGVLLHYLGKLKIQIFCRYLAIIPDIEENANKLHFKCTNFNSSMHV